MTSTIEFETMGYEAAIRREWVTKKDRKRRVFAAGGGYGDIAAFDDGYRRGLVDRKVKNLEEIKAKVGSLSLYHVTAEHVGGAGDRLDPTDQFELWVVAADADEAESRGYDELDKLAKQQPWFDANGCANHAGNERWWCSVCVTATCLTPEDAASRGLLSSWLV